MLSRRKKRVALAGILTTSIIAALGLSAAEHIWLAPASGSWITPSSWLGNIAPPSSGGLSTELRFTGAGGDVFSINNLGSPFTLNRLSLGYSGSGVFILHPATLEFAGTTPAISLNGNGSTAI